MARTSRTGTRTDLALLGAALLIAFVSLILPGAVRSRLQGSLRSTIAAPLVAAQAWAERGRQAISDHGRLVRNVDSLALAAQATMPLRTENERLRRLLGLARRLQWGFVPTELLQTQRGADEHTVLLAAGSTAGIRPFSPVIVPEGLIGMVTSADAASSTAILWTHPDFRASATTVDGAAFGIVAAHLGTGADRFLLEMRNVPFRTELKPGTLIVSSGLGNVFPRGIPIGVVLRETKTIEGWARTYLIRPIVSPDASSAAMVLLPPRAAAGVLGVWSTAESADGMQKAIVAAGDSAMADSVRRIDEQIAKLTLLDSLRRAAIYSGDSGVRVEGDSAASGVPATTRVPTVGAPGTVPPPATSLPATPAGAPGAVPSAVTPVAVPNPATVPGPRATGTPAPTTTGATPIRPRTAGDSTAPRRIRRRVPADSARNKPDSAAARRPPENPFKLPPGRGDR
jgi:rod shape-determining protein MreC